jgi:hypothetical protein
MSNGPAATPNPKSQDTELEALIRDYVDQVTIKTENGALAHPYDFAGKLSELIAKAYDERFEAMLATHDARRHAEVLAAIGEDEPVHAREDKFKQSAPWQRNQLRAQLRTAVTAIYGPGDGK